MPRSFKCPLPIMLSSEVCAASGVHKCSRGGGGIMSRPRIVGARRVTRCKYHAGDPQILGATARNLVLALHVGVHLVVVDCIVLEY
jgi:hypothetical protein